MALLGGDHHTVERGHHALELDPRFPASAGRVETRGIFRDEPFVAILQRLLEGGFDFHRAVGWMESDGLEGRHEPQCLEFSAPLGQGQAEQVLATAPQQVEGDEAQRHRVVLAVLGQEKVAIRLPAAEAFLEIREAELAAFGEGDELAVEDEVPLKPAGGGEDFRELVIKRPQVAGKQRDPVAVLMKLRADAVILRLEPDRRCEGQFLEERPVVLRVALERRGEHALDGHQRPQGGFGKFTEAGERGGFPDVTGEHMGITDFRRIDLEGGGDRVLDEALLQADP